MLEAARLHTHITPLTATINRTDQTEIRTEIPNAIGRRFTGGITRTSVHAGYSSLSGADTAAIIFISEVCGVVSAYYIVTFTGRQTDRPLPWFTYATATAAVGDGNVTFARLLITCEAIWTRLLNTGVILEHLTRAADHLRVALSRVRVAATGAVRAFNTGAILNYLTRAAPVAFAGVGITADGAVRARSVDAGLALRTQYVAVEANPVIHVARLASGAVAVSGAGFGQWYALPECFADPLLVTGLAFGFGAVAGSGALSF